MDRQPSAVGFFFVFGYCYFCFCYGLCCPTAADVLHCYDYYAYCTVSSTAVTTSSYIRQPCQIMSTSLTGSDSRTTDTSQISRHSFDL
eukprot:scaffold66554_cov17-Prasinocladus_malaysianus.AAC.1